ncbi:MAG: CapA family protein [Clostridia bacterium]
MRRFHKALTTLLALLTLLFPALSLADEITVTLGGDCVLGTREKWKEDGDTFDTVIAEHGMDWCFGAIAEPFLHDDMSLVNLEVVLQANSKGHQRGKQYTFRGDPSYAQILRAAGIEQVNLANNHYIDFGRSGRDSTRAALTAGGVAFSGYTYRYVCELEGRKLGFAGCRETTFLQSKAAMRKDLKALESEGCEVIFYSCHWGKEYSPTHNRTQERMADYAIANGADIVVGTHPHCVQGIEQRGKGVVIYSLGNLVFGGTHEMSTFDALIVQAKLRFGADGYEGVTLRLLPVLTSSDRPKNNFRPVWAEGADAERIMKLLQDDSDLDIQPELWFGK